MKASITANKNFLIGEIDNRIYGSFIEHIGRAVYNGIYEPTHPTADDQGFRKDVLELVKKLNVPIVRYPGGNFVSGYNWEDGTGDKSKRPQKQDLAWFALETNEVGIDEFQEWAKRADSQVMMAVNLGTRGADDARNCVEYCNAETDTYYANLRRQNGFEKPFGIKVWCLGNEMDGRWQICAKTPEEYARTATEAAKVMKWVDPSIELVACGSSGPYQKTFGEWELTVLEHAYEHIDYISLHSYYNNRTDDTPKFLARAEEMDRFIKGTAAICDAIKAKKHQEKTINLSFDEWNVWKSIGAQSASEKWTKAPHFIEDIYNFEDALLVGCLLMTLQNNCDRVKIACLAQLVNVIAPIMTENGGKAWVQTIFYPFMFSSLYGRGKTLISIVESENYVGATDKKQYPYLYSSVIDNADNREIIVFAANRSLSEDMELEVKLENYGEYKLISHTELYSDDLKAVNDKDTERVAPVALSVDTTAPIILKKHSWNMLRFKY